MQFVCLPPTISPALLPPEEVPVRYNCHTLRFGLTFCIDHNLQFGVRYCFCPPNCRRPRSVGILPVRKWKRRSWLSILSRRLYFVARSTAHCRKVLRSATRQNTFRWSFKLAEVRYLRGWWVAMHHADIWILTFALVGISYCQGWVPPSLFRNHRQCQPFLGARHDCYSQCRSRVDFR